MRYIFFFQGKIIYLFYYDLEDSSQLTNIQIKCLICPDINNSTDILLSKLSAITDSNVIFGCFKYNELIAKCFFLIIIKIFLQSIIIY